MRILIVDDEGSLLATLAANLELEGFEVVEAEDAFRAVELVEQQHFDLVLTDIRMPGMNGVELFRTIRATHPKMPVILMTGFAMEALIDEAIQEGVFAVLPKPFEIEHIIAALSRAVSRPMVLLLDDLEDAEPTSNELREVGLACCIVRNEEGALVAVKNESVDVVLLNVGIPGMNGVELAKQILSFDASIAIIAISSDSVSDLFRNVAALGAFACLVKPLDKNQLVRVIANARGRRAPRLRASHRVAQAGGDR